MPLTGPRIVTTSLPQATQGSSYSFQQTATGSAPIQWTLISGTLPPGLQMDVAGEIYGIPTSFGTSVFLVAAENAAGKDTQSITLQVIKSSTAPTIVTTSPITPAKIATVYSSLLSASGTLPISWSLDSESLPTGLSLNGAGEIAGTPTVAGTFLFRVRATNVGGSTTKQMYLAVYDPDTNLQNTPPNVQQVIVATAGQRLFTLNFDYLPGSNDLFVYNDGQAQSVGVNYEETSSNSVTILYPTNGGEEFLFFMIGSAATMDIPAPDPPSFAAEITRPSRPVRIA